MSIARRISALAIATMLLRVPYLNILGGAVLVWITWKLVAGNGDGEGEVKSGASFWGAISTIIVADLSMSFDNVMGVAGAAQGNIPLMIFGLLVSIPILVAGSSLLAVLMDRDPILVYVGGAVLAHTAVHMFFEDRGLQLSRYTGQVAAAAIPWVSAMAVLVWGVLRTRKAALHPEVGEVAADLDTYEKTLDEAVSRHESAD